MKLIITITQQETQRNRKNSDDTEHQNMYHPGCTKSKLTEK